MGASDGMIWTLDKFVEICWVCFLEIDLSHVSPVFLRLDFLQVKKRRTTRKPLNEGTHVDASAQAPCVWQPSGKNGAGCCKCRLRS